MGDAAHQVIREKRSSDEVSPETHESGGTPGGFFRRDLKSEHSDEHDRAVNEETKDDEREEIEPHRVQRIQPVKEKERDRQGHEDDGSDSVFAFEKRVAEPAADERSGDRGEFVKEVGPRGFVNVVVLCFHEVGRRPVADAVPKEVNESIGDPDQPKDPIVQNVFEDDLIGREFLFVLLGIFRRKVVFKVLDGGETAGLRRVSDEEPGNEGDSDRDDGREVEDAVLPVKEAKNADPESRDGSDEAAADIMRDIPNGDRSAAFL